MIRVGLGYDSHRFEPPGPLTLGGIRIPYELHLQGHSDGDAVCHALTDAILGAAGDDDIGQLYSDKDPAHAGRNSLEMLAEVVERVRARGFRVQQADVTIVTESPRLANHKPAMQEKLAGALRVDTRAVNVKAKSNEGMGWIGRGEGIACLAIATLVATP